MSSVTASERDPVQTEAFGQCGVRTDTQHRNRLTKSLGTERDTGRQPRNENQYGVRQLQSSGGRISLVNVAGIDR